ncbi:MAG: hypothetical protein AAGF19_11765, partial [Pseudomonadota bacterium]
LTESREATHAEYEALWYVLHRAKRWGLFDLKSTFQQLDIDEDVKKRVIGLTDHLLKLDGAFPKHFRAPGNLRLGDHEFDALFVFLTETGVWDYGVPLKLTAVIPDSLYWGAQARLGIAPIDLDRAEDQLVGFYRVYATTGLPKRMSRGGLIVFRHPITEVYHAFYRAPRLDASGSIDFIGFAIPGPRQTSLSLYSVPEGAEASAKPDPADPETAIFAPDTQPLAAILASEAGEGLHGHYVLPGRAGGLYAKRAVVGNTVEALDKTLNEAVIDTVRVDTEDLPIADMNAAVRLGLIVPAGGATRFEGAAAEAYEAPQAVLSSVEGLNDDR